MEGSPFFVPLKFGSTLVILVVWERLEALVLAIFDEFDFHQVLVSMKAFSVADTIKAERSDLPLHIEGTEAGLLFRHGKVMRSIDASEADSAFREELERL